MLLKESDFKSGDSLTASASKDEIKLKKK